MEGRRTDKIENIVSLVVKAEIYNVGPIKDIQVLCPMLRICKPCTKRCCGSPGDCMFNMKHHIMSATRCADKVIMIKTYLTGHWIREDIERPGHPHCLDNRRNTTLLNLTGF